MAGYGRCVAELANHSKSRIFRVGGFGFGDSFLGRGLNRPREEITGAFATLPGKPKLREGIGFPRGRRTREGDLRQVIRRSPVFCDRF